MTAFEIVKADGHVDKRILRQPSDWTLENVPNAVAHEYALLETLRDCGIAAPVPCARDERGEHFGRPSLVVEYRRGKPDLDPRDPQRLVEQLAQQLAAIHRIDPYDSGLLYLPEAPAVGSHDGEPHSDTREVFRVPTIRQRLAQHAAVQPDNSPTLLHGDFWPGNTLWRERTLVATIDWEEAKVGDPLLDLSISRLDILWIWGCAAMQRFTDTYLELAPTCAKQLSLWDLRAALRPVDNIERWASAYPPLARHDITAETMVARHRFFVDQALTASDQVAR